MSKPPPSIEPLGLRRRQGCARWLMMLVLVATVITLLAASLTTGL